MAIAFERIGDHHQVAAFTCDKPEMQAWLVKHALKNDRLGLGNTTIAVETTTNAVVGYFTICATIVRCEVLPAAEQKGMPKYPLPAILLARLARDGRCSGQRLGERLLIASMRAALAAGAHTGWRFLVVDALTDDVVPFYVKYGFTALQDDPRHLFMSAATVVRVVELTLPSQGAGAQ
jgi:hypothetical protein